MEKEEVVKKLESDIKSYLWTGMTPRQIEEIMRKDMETLYGGDADKFRLLIDFVYKRERKNMSVQAKQDFELIRQNYQKALKDNEIDRICNLVYQKTLEYQNRYSKLSDALTAAINFVSRTEGKSAGAITGYLREHPWLSNFYEYYRNNQDVTEKDLEAMAEEIIAKNMTISDASKKYHYYKMITHLENNRPDLLQKLQASFASHDAYSFVEPKTYKRYFNRDNFHYFARLILEYRVPIDVLYDFVTQTGSDFCTLNVRSAGDLLVALHNSEKEIGDYASALKWYLYEVSLPDAFTDYRVARFEKFKERYFTLGNLEQQKRLILLATQIDLSKVEEKINNRETQQYGFTLDERRALVRRIYNYGLSNNDVSKMFFDDVERTRKDEILTPLEKSEEVYDKMLVDGVKKLGEYRITKANFYGQRKF